MGEVITVSKVISEGEYTTQHVDDFHAVKL
jgi:hypothetical protein